MDILINKDTTAIVKKAELRDLPDFIVITGENGTGKSQFLAYLYQQVPYLSGNIEDMMMDGMRESNPDKGYFTNIDGQEMYTPNVQILDGGKELDNIACRTIYTTGVELGNMLNVSYLMGIGKNFAHKYIFYTTLKSESIGQVDPKFLDITILNRKYLEETGYAIGQNQTSNLPNSFTIEDKTIIEAILSSGKKVDYALLRYYYIAYRPASNSSVFSANIASLFLQYWAGKKIGIEVKESPLDVFNQIATEAKFRYTLQEPVITEDSPQVTLMMLDRETGNIVDINHLSSGEKVILSLVLAIYSSNMGSEFPEMILFDEPDAFLHPSLCKFMLDVLQNIFVKSKNIKVIITTHSPSTVAFTPEKSLYKMDRSLGYITKTTQKEAVELLSNGFLTFEEGVETFNVLKKSPKSTILCVEGKTDIAHITTAMEKLGRPLDIELVDLHDAGSLASFIKAIPASILGEKKIIGLFDNDQEGCTSYKNVKGKDMENYKVLTSEQSKNQAFVACIPLGNPLLDKYCPIEYLYSKEVLEAHDMLELRNFQGFKAMYKSDSSNATEDTELNNEHTERSSLRVFKVRDDKKKIFSDSVQNLSKEEFAGFIPLLDLLDTIIRS